MPVLEIVNYNKIKINSIFTSKFLMGNKSNAAIKKLNIYFITKKNNKKKYFFLYILIILIFDNSPKIHQSRSKKNKKNLFLGLCVKLKYEYLHSFFFFYLPILDIIVPVNAKVKGQFLRWSWKSLPIIYEVDKLCASNSSTVDYFQDYKMVYYIKFSSKLFYKNETLLRVVKAPIRLK